MSRAAAEPMRDRGDALPRPWRAAAPAGPRGPLARRLVLCAGLGALALLGLGLPRDDTAARHRRHRRRKRCRQHCKHNRRTCDHGCNILDDDSQHFCKQGCRVALSQCKGEC